MQLLYLTQNFTNDAGIDSNVRVFLALYDNSTGKLTSVNDLLTDSVKFRELTSTGYDLRVLKLKDYPNPLITLGDSIPGDVDLLRIDSIFTQVKSALNGASQLAPEIESRYVSIIAKSVNSESVAKLIIICCYAYLKLLNTNLDLLCNFKDVKFEPGFERQTQDWVNEQDRKNTMASIPDNETKFQNSCVSELFIRLPAYDAMFSYLDNSESDSSDSSSVDDNGESAKQIVRNLHSFMPAMEEVSDPYGVNTAMYTNPAHVQAMANSNSEVYMQALKEIVGNSANDTDKIFENEQRFYDALLQWMSIISINETGADVGDLCSISLEYLQTLAETLYIWYWQHSVRVPTSIGDAFSGEAYDESKYRYKSNGNTAGAATEDLINFLDRAYADLGREVYAKAIIQLARWGTRKPTSIVFDGYDKRFDLNTGTVTNALPTLSSYNKCSVNGKEYAFVGFIGDCTRIADPRIGFRRWPMPVGIVVRQVFKNKVSEETIELDKYYSMIDAVREAVKGDFSIDGLDYNADTDEWNVAEPKQGMIDFSEVNYAAKQPDQLQFPIFRSKSLIQIFSDLRIAAPSDTTTHFSIMNARQQNSKLLTDIDDNTFDTYMSLDALDKNGKSDKKRLTEYMITRDLLKVYHLAATRWQDGLDGAGIFKLWHHAILDSGYVDEAYFYKGVSKPSVPLPNTKVENFNQCFWRSDSGTAQNWHAPTGTSAATPKPISLAADNSEKGADFTMDNISSAILMQPSQGCEYCRFISDAGDIICTCAIIPRRKRNSKTGTLKPDPIYVVLDKATVESMNLPDDLRVFGENRLQIYFTKAFYTIALNKPEASNVRFINSAAIKDVYDYFLRRER